MVTVNPHFQKLKSGYLFPKIEQRKKELKGSTLELIDLGIGDITTPLLPAASKAFLEAINEMSEKPIGYGPSQGYAFLRDAIVQTDYKNLKITSDEIFVSNGAKCDAAHLLELFCNSSIVALCDPSYPVYVDSAVIAGKTGEYNQLGRYENILYIPLVKENSFMPMPPKKRADIVYLCSPNNPTGVALTRDVLKKWIEYAKINQTILIYDGAYEAFITQDCPHSIYEIEGAKDVAIEIRSYSKTAGFTGLRCSYTVIPKQLKAKQNKKITSLHPLWKRRHDTKFGGVSYPTQKAATALYTELGQKEVLEQVKIYQNQTKVLREGLIKLGYTVYGGIDAPYLWVKTPVGYDSWSYFDYLLKKLQIVSIPGQGFGMAGEGYIRLSAFTPMKTIKNALNRFALL